MFRFLIVTKSAPSILRTDLALASALANARVSPLPLMVTVFVVDAPPIAGITTCSVYGPEPVVTLNTMEPPIPHLIALIASAKLAKLVPPVAIALLIVYAPPGNAGGVTIFKPGVLANVAPQVMTAL